MTPHVLRAVFTSLFALTLACSANESTSGGNNGGAPNGTAGAGGSAGASVAGSSTGGGGTSAGNAPVMAGSGPSAAGATATGGSTAGGGASGGSSGSAGSGGGNPVAMNALFNEGFESYAAASTPAQAPWAASVNGDGTVAVDDSVAHSGSHSLKVHGSGFNSFLVLSLDALPAPAPKPLHVRAFVRLEEPMTAGHNTFLVADQKASPGAGNAFRLGEMNAMLMYTVNGDTHGALANQNYYTDHLPGAALAAKAWGCLEVTLDSATQAISVSLDGQDIPDLHHTDFPLDAYDTVRFGFEKYAGPVSDVWYDDIAVDAKPIGCN